MAPSLPLFLVIRKNPEGDFQNCSSSFACALSHAVCLLSCCPTVFWQMFAPSPAFNQSPSEAEGKGSADLSALPAAGRAQAAVLPSVRARGCVDVRKSGFRSEITNLLTVCFGGKLLCLFGVSFLLCKLRRMWT